MPGPHLRLRAVGVTLDDNGAVLGCRGDILGALVEAMADRGGSDEWIATERAVVADAANRWAESHGYERHVTVDDVERIEVAAVGHSDYASKLALYVAEFVVAPVSERTGMCPHCGEILKMTGELTPTHDWPKLMRQVCPGSQQNPRNAESDGRPLWNGESNPHFYRNQPEYDANPPRTVVTNSGLVLRIGEVGA